MADLYSLLNVNKSASAEEIKSAYRKLAKKLHPDVNPGRKDIEQKFKEITAAYDILSDKEKRAKYDRGEIDSGGQDRGFGGFGGGGFGGDPFAGARARAGRGGNPFGRGGMNPEDILSSIFGGAMGGGFGGGRPESAPAQDTNYNLTVDFVTAVRGGGQRVAMASGRMIDVNVPPASQDGDKLRLRGMGDGGGDAIVEIKVSSHAYFTRKDQDIYLDVPVSLKEAILGASIAIPTLDGQVMVKIAQGTNADTTLRLKGKGVPAAKGKAMGDMYAKIKIALPESVPQDLINLVEKMPAYDARKKTGWG